MDSLDKVEVAKAAADVAMTAFYSYWSGDLGYLDDAIRMATIAAATIPEGHPSRPGYLNNLAEMLRCKYRETGGAGVHYLEASKQMAQQAMNQTPDGDPARADWLDTLANIFETQFEQTGDRNALMRAIEIAQNAATTCPLGSPGRPVLLNNLSNKLFHQFKLSGEIKHIQDSIAMATEALDSTLEDHPDRPAYLTNCASKLEIAYDRALGPQYLADAVAMARQSVNSTAAGDRLKRAGRLINLGILLRRQYEQCQRITVLEEAIQVARESVGLTPPGYTDLGSRLDTLSSLLSMQYEQTKNTPDIDGAIQAGQRAVDLTPQGHSERLDRLSNLGNKFRLRHFQTGDTTSLDSAIRLAREVVESVEEGGVGGTAGLLNLAKLVKRRYDLSKATQDLEEAVRAMRRAIDSMSDGDPDLPGCWQGMADCLQLRYESEPKLSYLEESIDATRRALDATQGNNVRRANLLDDLGARLCHAYRQTTEAQTLLEAIRVLQEAVELAPDPNIDRARHLGNLAGLLEYEYTRTGDVLVLEESIQLAQDAVMLTPEGDSDRGSSLNNLANSLQRLFERTGEIQHIDGAVEAAEGAIESTRSDHPSLSLRLSNLGSKYMHRYDRLRNPEDLEDSIKAARRAVSECPVQHSDRCTFINGLCNRLSSRFERLGAEAEAGLEEAIKLLDEALKRHPRTGLYLAPCLDTFGRLLRNRHELKKDVKDLDRAIKAGQDALDMVPVRDPNRAAFLRNLGLSLAARANTSGSAEDLNAALRAFLEAAKQDEALPLSRVYAARGAIAILNEFKDWNQAAAVGLSAAELLPVICGRYVSPSNQQHAITQVSGLAADVCRVLLRTGKVEMALEQVERGRGLILGYMIDDHSDWADLKRASPTMAERYDALHLRAARFVNGEEAVGNDSIKERMDAMREMEECIAEIRRTVPGQERFLMGSTVVELKAHAAEGPIVVVNVTEMGADAIVFSHSQVKHLPLPGLSPSTAPQSIRRKFSRYASFRNADRWRDIGGEDKLDGEPDELSWLWTNCVELVLRELEASGNMSAELARVWWIGSGIASSFPLHAAQTDSKSCLDHVISSYTPTIKALGYSRSQTPSMTKPNAGGKASILVVTMPTTPGQPPLKGAKCEAYAIQTIPAETWSVTELELPTSARVLGHIQTSDIIHFACHGSSDPLDPLHSHLLLQGASEGAVPIVDRLTISMISKVAAEGRARVAFLSACSTAEIKASTLGDEGLHLASAFQVVGFASVIGSQWRVSDDVCVELAGAFYTELARRGLAFSNRDVADVLRSAILRVRATHPNNPDLWSPFVHCGA
jgi:hypothetical protein